MKKILFFIIILFLYLFLINQFIPEKLTKELKKDFFLYLREIISFQSLTVDDFFLPKYEIKKISGEDFFIDTVKFNYFTKDIELVDGIFMDSFKNKLFDLLKNFEILKISFKKIKFINCKFIYKPYIIENFNGDYDLKNNSLNIYGFIENKPFNLAGKILNNKVNFILSLNNIKFNEFLNEFLNIPQINFINLNKKIDVKVELKGELSSINFIKFNGKIDNNTEIDFNLINEINSYRFSNGVVKFFNDDVNKILFSGKIFKDGSWSFIFQAKDDILKIPYKNKVISLKDIDLDYSINNLEGNEIGILKFYCGSINAGQNIYHLFKYFLNKKNYSYAIFIDSLNIDNISVSNLDVQLSSNNGVKSIEKFNFQMDTSKVLFSMIKKDNIFRMAVNAKKIKIKKLIKFLTKKDLNLSGEFNVTYLGFGKNNKFTSGKGYINGKDIEIKHIDFTELDNIFKTHDIKNIKLFNDNSDNESDNSTKKLKILFLKSNVNVENEKIMLKKVSIKGEDFFANLNGYFEPNGFSNMILSGNYVSKDASTEIIINLNIKEKFLQFIGK